MNVLMKLLVFAGLLYMTSIYKSTSIMRELIDSFTMSYYFARIILFTTHYYARFNLIQRCYYYAGIQYFTICYCFAKFNLFTTCYYYISITFIIL